jgi:hypothetical protein
MKKEGDSIISTRQDIKTAARFQTLQRFFINEIREDVL